MGFVIETGVLEVSLGSSSEGVVFLEIKVPLTLSLFSVLFPVLPSVLIVSGMYPFCFL